MSDDTAQAPRGPAETVVAPDPYIGAAEAFKVALGQAEPPKRDAAGRFAPAQEIEAPEEAEEAEAGAESHEEPEPEEEAAEEAQLAEADLPSSWPAEHAELWETLPPEAQAVISKREGERDRAVNQKFQEAANLRQAHEAEINEANVNRQRYAEAVDEVLSLVVPKIPPRSMLDINSSDYDPDTYHYQKASYEDTVAYLNQHAAQRQQLAAQEQNARFQAINSATRDTFISLVPDVADQAKAPAIFTKLMEYAVSQGAPPDLFQTPTTALEWTVLEKARRYDELQSAKARVSQDPVPTPRKPQPTVRPGVTTPRSAVEAAGLKKAQDRLAKSGSIEDGAAIWKHAMKGMR